MSCIAVIPARGGSKGLPGKNKRIFAGKPLLFWTIDAALRCPDIDEVYVSTDCPDIQALACRFGAKAPDRRPVELSTDTARSIDAVHHAVVSWSNDKAVEIVVMLQVTSPLRTHHDISAALGILCSRAPAVDAVASVTCASKHPLKAYCLQEGLLQPFLKRTGPIRTVNRQELQCAYQENGAIYAFNWKTHLMVRRDEENQGLLCGLHALSVAPYIMSVASSHDIDCEEDWRTAEDEFIKRFFSESPSFSLAGRMVGLDYPPLVIADVGIKCGNGVSIDAAAVQMIRIAKAAGAECVKFHILQEGPPAHSILDNKEAKTLNMTQPIFLGRKQEQELRSLAEHSGLMYLASPYPHSKVPDNSSAFWDSVPGFVIPGSRCSNLPMVSRIAAFKKPALLTVTEDLSIEDLRVAVDVLQTRGTPFAILFEPMQSSSLHPYLRRLEKLRRSFPGAIIGLSDRSCVNYSCFGAIPLGASVLCKTFTQKANGLDSDSVARSSHQLLDLVKGCRAIWAVCK